MGIASLITGAVVLGNVLTPPKFCDGVRSAEQYNGMTYKDYLNEYALDTVAAQKTEDQAILDAKAKGYSESGAYMIGLRARASAKALMAKVHSSHVKNGQRSLCGKESSNW